MTDEEIRIKVATICGYTGIRMSNRWEVSDFPDDAYQLMGYLNGWKNQIPEYTTDLNAMRQAEEILVNHPTDQPWMSDGMSIAEWRFVHHLGEVVGVKLINHEGLTTYAHMQELKLVKATAKQRAEAFLRTLEVK